MHQLAMFLALELWQEAPRIIIVMLDGVSEQSLGLHVQWMIGRVCLTLCINTEAALHPMLLRSACDGTYCPLQRYRAVFKTRVSH